MSQRWSRRSFIRRATAGLPALSLAAGAARGYPAHERVRIGWIGYGGRASQLLNHMLETCPDAVHAAICDLKPERIEAGRKDAQRDSPEGFADFREMMDKVRPDGIIIATEPCSHAVVAVPVLEAGFHVFCEKPMDTTVEKVDALVRAARKSKGIFQIGTQRRYHPGYLSALRAIHEGILGRVTFMQGGWHWSTDPSGGLVARDGGRLIEQATHHTDVMSWVMKEQHPVTCVSMASAQNPRPEGPNVFSETHSATVFRFPDGTLFSYTHLWLLPGRYDAEILTVFGEKGAVDLNQGMYYGRDEKEQRVGVASGKQWDMGTPESLQDFVANIRSGGKRKPNANAETGRVSTLMCMMARMAMVDPVRNAYEPRVVHWKDLGSTTEPE